MVSRHVPAPLTQTETNELIDDVNNLKNGVTLDGVRSYPDTYIVRKNGVYYEAIDAAHNLAYGGSTDEGSTSGGNALDVLQAANDAIGSGGGLIFIKNAVYPFDGTLTIGNNVSLIGEGAGTWVYPTLGTVLKATTADTILSIDGPGGGTPYYDFNRIENIGLDGDNSAEGAILLDHTWGTALRNVSIRNCNSYGLKAVNYVQNFLWDHGEIYNIDDGASGGVGINWGDSAGVNNNSPEFRNLWIASCGSSWGFDAYHVLGATLRKVAFTTCGFRLYNGDSKDSNGLELDGCWFEASPTNAVSLYRLSGGSMHDCPVVTGAGTIAATLNLVYGFKFYGNVFWNNGEENIYADACYGLSIENNRFNTSGVSDPSITFTATHSGSIKDNIFKSSGTDVSISLLSNSDYNNIYWQDTNDTTLCTGTPKQNRFIGGKFENSGYATIANGSATVAHSLCATPTNVNVTAIEPTSGGSAVIASWANKTADATTFTVALNRADGGSLAGTSLHVSWYAHTKSS